MHRSLACILFAVSFFALDQQAIAAPVKDKPESKANHFPDHFDTEAFLVAHLRIGEIWSGVFTRETLEKVAKVKGGLEALLDFEKTFRRKNGFWFGDFETATFYVPEVTGVRELPAFALILTRTKAFDTKQFLANERLGELTKKGLIPLRSSDGQVLLHFPDERTAVILHESLTERYLAGYAKDRTTWPMSKALIKAAEKNTFVALLNTGRFPAEIRGDVGKYAPALINAKNFIAAGNWKANEFRFEVRASFLDDATAKQAHEESKKWLGELTESIGKTLNEKQTIVDMGAAIVLLQELHRSFRDAKFELFGPDLIAKTVYKVDLPLEKIAVELAEKRRLAAERGPSQNNLKMIGEAIHNYASANGGEQLIVWGMEAKAVPVKNLKAKPLFSWRVALLPYLGKAEAELYGQFKFDEPWDSEHNKKLIAKMPKVFAPVNNVKAAEGHTFYQMIIGPRVMRPGAFNIGNLTDGTMNTVAVAEAAEPVIWTKPDDIFIPGEQMPKNLNKKFGGLFKDGFNVLMYDGSVRWVDPRKVSDLTLWLAVRPDDGLPMPLEWYD